MLIIHIYARSLFIFKLIKQIKYSLLSVLNGLDSQKKQGKMRQKGGLGFSIIFAI
ncbi:hypothetical protein THERMOT_1906 [Bathymodiolus thermophilus thioautotrophic gill symbiont]|nr:hypothetical protein THERMOT_1906 [Bathymodiolus thermophilus thioautotrophic gill symbiont]